MSSPLPSNFGEFVCRLDKVLALSLKRLSASSSPGWVVYKPFGMISVRLVGDLIGFSTAGFEP